MEGEPESYDCYFGKALKSRLYFEIEPSISCNKRKLFYVLWLQGTRPTAVYGHGLLDRRQRSFSICAKHNGAITSIAWRTSFPVAGRLGVYVQL